jgi:hypothetical protein
MNNALLNDLSLVLAEPYELSSAQIHASVHGQPVELNTAIERAAKMICDSSSPVITGIHMLTMQATRAAVDLARKMQGRVLQPETQSYSVQQTATLGHVMGCDFVIKPGPAQWAAEHPVAAAIAKRVLHSIFVPPDLDTLLGLRAKVRQKGAAAICDITHCQVNRLAVVLPPECPFELVSQWHKLAADLQTQIRACVLRLPDMATAGNMRGAAEVVLWLTGLNGQVDFGGSQIATDLQIDASENGVIRVGNDIQFTTPGLAMGLHAHVMRFDGIVLRLCDDPEVGIPDPVVELFERIGKAI